MCNSIIVKVFNMQGYTILYTCNKLVSLFNKYTTMYMGRLGQPE